MRRAVRGLRRLSAEQLDPHPGIPKPRLVQLPRIQLRVGGLSLSLVSADADHAFGLEPLYLKFATCSPSALAYLVHFDETPALTFDRLIFETGVGWRLYDSAGNRVVQTHTRRGQVRQVAVLTPDFGSGDIYVRQFDSDETRSYRPLAYPLGIVLTINLLAQGHGLLLHACGVNDAGRGYLYLGTGGSGKTTTAHLWASHTAATVLSDDRVILRERDGRFWICGTPWPGQGGMAEPGCAPLEHVFLLRHDSANRAEPIERAAAAARVLANSFPTYWDANGMTYTLGLLGRLAGSVPCSELGFVPEASAVDYVRCLS